MYLRLNKADWSNYAEVGDYSYDANRTVISRWDHITLYRNGNLMWGVEPLNSQPGATPTQVANTMTATNTNIPATEMKTATPIPATATKTNTPAPIAATATRTSTSIPATATKTATLVPATSTAGSSNTVKIQYQAGAIGGTSQTISPKLILFNTGNASISLNEIKIRYWFTEDGTQPQSYWCDYAAVGCENISAQFVPMQTAKPGADYYLELSFTSGAGSLAPGANTGQIQSRFSKNDWSYYTQTGDYSFDSSKTQFADWNHVTVYRNGTLVWGSEP